LVLSRLAPAFDSWEVDETLRRAAVVLGIEGTENADLSLGPTRPPFQATSGIVEEPQTIAVAATPPQPAIQSAAAVVTENPPAEVPETRPQSADTAAFKHIEVAETIELPVIRPQPMPEDTAVATAESEPSSGCVTPEPAAESKTAAAEPLRCSEPPREEHSDLPVAATSQPVDPFERTADLQDEIYPIRQAGGFIAAVERFQGRMVLPALAWITTFLGTMALVCGGALLLWSQIVHRAELWPIGQPIALGGAFVLVLGLALQWDRAS
jgi:hypothetical protein